jgi:hypothetical protein
MTDTTHLTDPLEVIAAFVDGERVNPQALEAALSLPDGRAYLIDLVGMREIVGFERATAIAPVAAPATKASPSGARVFAPWIAAAAMVACLAGGYAFGWHLAGADARARVAAADRAPEPTRVVDVKWQDTNGGN